MEISANLLAPLALLASKKADGKNNRKYTNEGSNKANFPARQNTNKSNQKENETENSQTETLS